MFLAVCSFAGPISSSFTGGSGTDGKKYTFRFFWKKVLCRMYKCGICSVKKRLFRMKAENYPLLFKIVVLVCIW